MKIYFIRHGEAMDDVKNEYGGWYDTDLSPKGFKSGEEIGKKLKEKGLEAEAILTSPLKRAYQTAKQINKFFDLPLETFIYLKERNTYGLLCGLNKKEAKEKYPDLAKAYENNQPVHGYEPYDMFLARVKEMVNKLRLLNYNSVICVTHGKLLKALTNDVMSKKASEFEDNCILEVNLDSDGNLEYLNSEGITFN